MSGIESWKCPLSFERPKKAVNFFSGRQDTVIRSLPKYILDSIERGCIHNLHPCLTNVPLHRLQNPFMDAVRSLPLPAIM